MEIYNTDKEQEYLTDERCHIIEILNDDQIESVSLAQARVEPSVKTKLHALSGTKEIYYILEGQGVATVNGVSKTLNIGDCVVIESDMPQCIENTGSVDLIFLCICQPRFQFSNYKDVEL